MKGLGRRDRCHRCHRRDRRDGRDRHHGRDWCHRRDRRNRCDRVNRSDGRDRCDRVHRSDGRRRDGRHRLDRGDRRDRPTNTSGFKGSTTETTLTAASAKVGETSIEVAAKGHVDVTAQIEIEASTIPDGATCVLKMDGTEINKPLSWIETVT